MRRGLCALGLLLGLGCEQIIDADFGSAEARPATSGSSVCDSLRPLPPPDIEDGGEGTAFSVVVDAVDYGEGGTPEAPDYFTVGVDVDEECTLRGQVPRCLAPGWTDGDVRDGPRGQDNAVGKLLFTQRTTFGFSAVSTAAVNENVRAGSFAPAAFFEVSGYNGFTSDDAIVVKWTVPRAADQAGLKPAFDGSDEWPLAARPDGSEPYEQLSTRAYVTQRRLVARFDGLPIPLANVYLETHAVTIMADIVFDAPSSQWRLESGLIAGQSGASTLLKVIPGITSTFLGAPLCTDNPNYSDTKAFLCGALDTASADHQPGAPCDGYSIGIAFTAKPAKRGPVAAPPELPRCPKPLDPAYDTCDKR